MGMLNSHNPNAIWTEWHLAANYLTSLLSTTNKNLNTMGERELCHIVSKEFLELEFTSPSLQTLGVHCVLYKLSKNPSLSGSILTVT